MFTMKQACEQTQLSYETLKFYCNQGLIPNVKRDKNNRRVFDENDIAWINSLKCLKKCGMSLGEMKEYLSLCLAGEVSIPERKIILDIKRESLLDQLKQIQDAINYIDWKQGFYDDVLSGKTTYYSNLIKTDNSISS
jgi:MerR family transcriptional regulator, aldehyde-responsive regulator